VDEDQIQAPAPETVYDRCALCSPGCSNKCGSLGEQVIGRAPSWPLRLTCPTAWAANGWEGAWDGSFRFFKQRRPGAAKVRWTARTSGVAVNRVAQNGQMARGVGLNLRLLLEALCSLDRPFGGIGDCWWICRTTLAIESEIHRYPTT